MIDELEKLIEQTNPKSPEPEPDQKNAEQINRIQELLNRINSRNINSFKAIDEPSDWEYDKDIQELQELQKQVGLTFAIPTLDNTTLPEPIPHDTIPLPHAIASIRKAKTVSEAIEFLKDHNTLLTVKLAGVGCSVKYMHGKLQSVILKTDYLTGLNITDFAMTIESIPHYITTAEDEVVIEGNLILDGFEDFMIPEEEREFLKKKSQADIILYHFNHPEKQILIDTDLKFIGWGIPVGSRFSTYADDLYEIRTYGLSSIMCLELPFLSKEVVQLAKPIVEKMYEDSGYLMDGFILIAEDISGDFYKRGKKLYYNDRILLDKSENL